MEGGVSFYYKKHLGSWHLRSDGVLKEKERDSRNRPTLFSYLKRDSSDRMHLILKIPFDPYWDFS